MLLGCKIVLHGTWNVCVEQSKAAWGVDSSTGAFSVWVCVGKSFDKVGILGGAFPKGGMVGGSLIKGGIVGGALTNGGIFVASITGVSVIYEG